MHEISKAISFANCQVLPKYLRLVVVRFSFWIMEAFSFFADVFNGLE